MNRRALLTAFAAVLCVAGCTGVPSSSTPEEVQRIRGGQSPQAAPLPPAGASPRDLVIDFLASNAIDAVNRGAARVYLTAAARNRWSDSSVTVVDTTRTSTYDTRHHTITVTGRVVGTIDESGIYTPDLQGLGVGGESVPFGFTLSRVHGEYRIDQLRNGLVITADEFEQVFQQLVVYFYDAQEQYLVPDVRFTALTDTQLRANWLVGQLLAQPRPALQNAESNAEFPAGADARNVSVKVGSPTTIEIPGAAELDSTHRNRLAAQLALTLDQVVSGGVMSITDGGHPVNIPAAGGVRFTASGFRAVAGPQSLLPHPTVFFLRNGAVLDSEGRPLDGALGAGEFDLTSVALAKIPASTQLFVAGVTGTDSAQRLLVGTQAAGLKPTKVTGRLTRPSWAAGLDEVWVGSGSTLYRVTSSGRQAKVPTPGLPAGDLFVALRLSPDGSRVALVVSDHGAQQLYIGTIARGGGQVRVDGLTAISPNGVQVTDVAWNDALKLFVIGTIVGTLVPKVIEVQVDGSLWAARDTDDLPPQAPDSITVAESLPAWVSVAGTVWQQNGSSWLNPLGSLSSGQTVGTNPIYLE